jgi:hypothetical protein
MRYRYTRAFIVEGALAREAQEITLFDEPSEGRKFVLTSTPDSFLADADKSAAVGLISISKISVAGFPPPPFGGMDITRNFCQQVCNAANFTD